LNYMSKYLCILALFIRNLLTPFLFSIPKYIHSPLQMIIIGLAYYFEKDKTDDFFISRKNLKRKIFIGIILTPLFCGTEYIFDYWRGEAFTTFYWKSFFLLPVFVLTSGWRAGIYEELLYRSLLMGLLLRKFKNPIFPILIQGILFYVAHPRYLQAGSWGAGLMTLVTGLTFGIITYKTKSIIPTIIIHSTINVYGLISMPFAEAFIKAINAWGLKIL